MTAPRPRMTPPSILARKGGEPIACLTAYTTPMAKLVDEHVDLMLVGDSLGMVVYGLPSTLGVTMEMMIAHGQAVMRADPRACVVVDMPFASYEESLEQAFRNAARIMAETGCAAVKLEGGEAMAPTIRFLTERSVPVMSHIGLRPQAVNTFGGYKVQGRDDASRAQILADAKAVAEAGAFSVVIEKTAEDISRAITQAITIPTIGIGASMACDGQILVTEDILGLFVDFRPKFAKPYAELGKAVATAAQSYAADVRARKFPGPEHVFLAKKP
ncbi:MAG: 3-methyl-2-oxobutanoate hydroxymethyltransferase [Alphaproteobacteria bacterium]|jgi:3-methyl-2-oxobutanoate hydroxymethyltransferase